jgi:transposase
MPQINSIKEMARDGQSVAGIARELGTDEKTVRKYLDQEDFSPLPPEEAERASKLDPHKGLIDLWLKADLGRWHKQRHTAKRIHDRLTAESPVNVNFPKSPSHWPIGRRGRSSVRLPSQARNVR